MNEQKNMMAEGERLETVVSTMKPVAKDYFSVLAEMISQPLTADVYLPMYALLQRLCEDFSADRVFSNLFSRLGFVCRQCGLSDAEILQMQQLRRKCHYVEAHDLERQSFLQDVRRMAEFVGKVFKCRVPASLLSLLPIDLSFAEQGKSKAFYPCLRVVVRNWDERYIYAEKDEGTADACEIKIDYQEGGFQEDLLYLKDLLFPELLLNLLKVKVRDDGVYVPQTVIVLPDYLVDVSTLAECWKEYGHDARNYILSHLSGHEDTPYTLLGHLAGQFLDDLINGRGAKQDVTYADCLRKSFATMPVAYSYVQLYDKFNFHDEARKQFGNLKKLIDGRLETDFGFDLSKALIEPSFICEALGVSGRMDFLQSDFARLIEQKSGKMDEFRHAHREPHFIQMMLYQAMLQYNLGVTNSRCDTYLLYSKYPDGLFREEMYQALLRDVLKMRNLIVIQELNCANGQCRFLLENLTPESLRTGANNKLWMNYQQVELEHFLKPFQVVPKNADDVEAERRRLAQDYFFRFYTFLCREQLQSKITSPGNAGRAFSDLWNLPAAMRRELGGLYMNLRVGELREMIAGQGVSEIRLNVEEKDDGFLSNFRKGDVVLLYRYEGEEPDVRRQFLMRGRLSEIGERALWVELNHPQRNRQVFMGEEARFAIEHDMMESTFNRLYAGLYSFLTGLPERQDLILDRRNAEMVAERPLLGNYGNFNDLVIRERCARDYFLVIGPPGSGKTSQAIRFMVEEELRAGEGNLLLLAYTNRAVDELCEMLETIIKETPECLSDYVRIGAELSSEEHFRKRLLTRKCSGLKNVDAVKKLIEETRVFVATTTAISSQTELLRHKYFSTAFIDEASQILEPQLLTLLFSKQEGEHSSIGRFVLVGDQKQLPAVVQQPPAVSKVTEESLIKIGLGDCRNSLFERLLSLQQKNGSPCVYLLEKQGRMHPELFQFVNTYFYRNQLCCVPLPHQQCTLENRYAHSVAGEGGLLGVLASHRTAFLNCKPVDDGTNDKINSAEAALVAQSLQALQVLYHREGRELQAENVGIIVPYRNQIAMIHHEMEHLHLDDLSEISIDTVERYQGSQRDVIFFLFTVRHLFQLAFMTASTYVEKHDADRQVYEVDRKLNVALTRAREQMFLIGDAPLLEHNRIYHLLIEQYRQNGSFFESENLLKREA